MERSRQQFAAQMERSRQEFAAQMERDRQDWQEVGGAYRGVDVWRGSLSRHQEASAARGLPKPRGETTQFGFTPRS